MLKMAKQHARIKPQLAVDTRSMLHRNSQGPHSSPNVFTILSKPNTCPCCSCLLGVTPIKAEGSHTLFVLRRSLALLKDYVAKSGCFPCHLVCFCIRLAIDVSAHTPPENRGSHNISCDTGGESILQCVNNASVGTIFLEPTHLQTNLQRIGSPQNGESEVCVPRLKNFNVPLRCFQASLRRRLF